MISKSRVEIDFLRLLDRCKQLVPSHAKHRWRMDKVREELVWM